MKIRTQLWMILVLIGSVLTTGTACKKENVRNPDQPKTVEPVITPVGVSKGTVATKMIGTAGGQLISADQQVTLTIPAGALNANTTIGIEPITNTNIAGIGNTAYRLTPHGQVFAKPVEIRFSWDLHTDSIGLLQTLGLAYQMDNRAWKFVGANSVDEEEKTISFKTTHFSDWSLMNQLSLAPYQADLEPGQTQTITALIFTDVKEGDLFPVAPVTSPGNYDEPGYPVGHPQALPSKFIKQWKLAGPGKITNISSNVVNYQAPASVSDYTTAAVSLELKAPAAHPGEYALISNINILGGSYVELSIGGAQPVTFPATPVVKMGDRYLLSNPEDEGGGYFLLTWTGGIGEHPWDLSNIGTYIHFITPNTTYLSQYRENPEADLTPSTGSVKITRLSGGWAEGSFLASKAGYTETLVPTTSLSGKFKVKLAP